MQKQHPGSRPPVAGQGAGDKQAEYFLNIYKQNLDTVYVDEKNIPIDYESIKKLYLGLKQHSQLIARQLRETIDKNHRISDELSKFKGEK